MGGLDHLFGISVIYTQERFYGCTFYKEFHIFMAKNNRMNKNIAIINKENHSKKLKVCRESKITKLKYCKNSNIFVIIFFVFTHFEVMNRCLHLKVRFHINLSDV